MKEKDEKENNTDEQFNLLDFDGKPAAGKPAPKAGPEPAPKAEGSAAKQINSIEELKPELKKTITNLLKSIPKEEVRQLLNEMESQKEILFDKENTSAFGNLTDKDQNILIEKMAEWEVPEELSNLNASVIISWLNNTIKENKK